MQVKAMTIKKYNKRQAIVITCLLVVYLATYIVLSSMGEYALRVKGLRGYQAYRWEPCGFKNNGVSTPLYYIFLPAYLLDTRWIHPLKEEFVPVVDVH